MKICPICIQLVSNFAMAIGKVVQINGIYYHIACIGETKIKDVEQGKWDPIKVP